MFNIQTSLIPRRVHRWSGPLNLLSAGVQKLRLGEGCPNRCPYCHEPARLVSYPVPEIISTQVQILDMNFLARPGDPITIIKDLGERRVDGKVVQYELVCGMDYRLLTPEIAQALHDARFIHPRIAWDWHYDQNPRIREALKFLLAGGYRDEEIMVFILCNWKIRYSECLAKMDLCKVWRVKAADCYFDGQSPPRVQPVHWTADEITTFRRRVRKHNQLVRFKIDPEPSKNFK